MHGKAHRTSRHFKPSDSIPIDQSLSTSQAQQGCQHSEGTGAMRGACLITCRASKCLRLTSTQRDLLRNKFVSDHPQEIHATQPPVHCNLKETPRKTPHSEQRSGTQLFPKTVTNRRCCQKTRVQRGTQAQSQEGRCLQERCVLIHGASLKYAQLSQKRSPTGCAAMHRLPAVVLVSFSRRELHALCIAIAAAYGALQGQLQPPLLLLLPYPGVHAYSMAGEPATAAAPLLSA
jgi:hypothetical protein